METHDLDSWSQFSPLIASIRNQYGTETMPLDDGRDITRSHQVLFRGQSNSDWELRTTLERKTQDRFDILRYLIDATHCVNEIESFTGTRWKVPEFPSLREEISKIQDSMRVHLPCYDYLVYLRHHGFPSPLLDWTESPYIASYFAFFAETKSERVAVYAYIE